MSCKTICSYFLYLVLLVAIFKSSNGSRAFNKQTSYQQPVTIAASLAKKTYELHSYKFVDDSFAAKPLNIKPAWKSAKSVFVEAKNFGDGSFTGETIKAAIEAR